MKPAALGEDRQADQESDRHGPGEKEAEADENDDADAGDGDVLALEIGLRALAHGGGNFLHAL